MYGRRRKDKWLGAKRRVEQPVFFPSIVMQMQVSFFDCKIESKIKTSARFEGVAIDICIIRE